jgi:hypothetical protein
VETKFSPDIVQLRGADYLTYSNSHLHDWTIEMSVPPDAKLPQTRERLFRVVIPTVQVLPNESWTAEILYQMPDHPSSCNRCLQLPINLAQRHPPLGEHDCASLGRRPAPTRSQYPGLFNAQYMTRMARIALMPPKAMPSI